MPAPPTEDIQYLRTLTRVELIQRARENPSAALAIVLAENMAADLGVRAAAKRVAPNHPAFYGA